MKNGFHRMLLLGTACLYGGAVNAESNVVFLGGGYAQLCSAAAHDAESMKDFEITGTRLATPPIEICTLAISGGGLTRTEIAGSYNNRGVLFFTEGAIAEALADFDASLALTELIADVHINRGYALISLGRWGESIASFDKGIALVPTQLDRAHFNRGLAHEEVGNIREAYYDYLKAAELNPEWEDPKLELARFTVTR